ncbi:hypothetical protein Cgig2_020512 [Carnegiea gigantea]|uniref:Uncharacterized protein n=1 Tax=Carnegiea gigantea TaxID=171969 RepID=A0A9Q1QFL5_9CARY|nr:hypothetical protein Cgig2_020512 [Carnegiea gigantea]
MTLGIFLKGLLSQGAKSQAWRLLERRAHVSKCSSCYTRYITTFRGIHAIGEWMDFKEKLAYLSSYWQVPSITHILKLSHDQSLLRLLLPIPQGQRRLFKRKLISLDLRSGNQNSTDEAENNILRLKEQGFFLNHQNQNVNWLRMHDRIHDLAVFVAKSKYKMERICHVFFSSDKTVLSNGELPCFLLFKVHSKLRSLLVSSYDYIAVSELNQSKFECLTVLSLEHKCQKKYELISLQYLDLSRNYFSKLPNSITRLIKFVSLDLPLCRELLEQPRDLNRLEKLLLLDISYCGQLQKLPNDTSKLKNLLPLDVVFCSLLELPRGISKLVKLVEKEEAKWYGGNTTLIINSKENIQKAYAVNLDSNHSVIGLQALDLFVARDRSSCSAKPNYSNDSDDDYVGEMDELNCLNNLKGTIIVHENWLSELEDKAVNL